MQGYLFIGGNDDGLTHPAPNDADTIQWPTGITGRETYHRQALSMGNVSIIIYQHESLAREQVLVHLVERDKVWTVNRPGGRRI